MTDVSVDMTANGFDASESFTLDRSTADDMVPVADPGMDRPMVKDSDCPQNLRTDERSAQLACGIRDPQQRYCFQSFTNGPAPAPEVGSADRPRRDEGSPGESPIMSRRGFAYVFFRTIAASKGLYPHNFQRLIQTHDHVDFTPSTPLQRICCRGNEANFSGPVFDPFL